MNPGTMSRDGLKVMARTVIRKYGVRDADMLAIHETYGHVLSDNEQHELLLLIAEAATDIEVTWADDK